MGNLAVTVRGQVQGGLLKRRQIRLQWGRHFIIRWNLENGGWGPPWEFFSTLEKILLLKYSKSDNKQRVCPSLFFSCPHCLLSGTSGASGCYQYSCTVPGDVAYPALLSLCLLPGRVGCVFNAPLCSETHLFTASFILFFFILPFQIVLKQLCIWGCLGFFFLF